MHNLEQKTARIDTLCREARILPVITIDREADILPMADALAAGGLTALEIKASFTEDLVDHLNQVVVRQQQQIDLLIREVADLRRQGPDEGGATFRSLRDELPPHY